MAGINFMACTVDAKVIPVEKITKITDGRYLIKDGQTLDQVMAVTESKWVRGENNPFNRWGIGLGVFVELIKDWFSNNNIDYSDYVFATLASQTSCYISCFKKGTSFNCHTTGLSTDPNPTFVWFDGPIPNETYAKIILYCHVDLTTEDPVVDFNSYTRTDRFPNGDYNPASNQACNQGTWDPDEYAFCAYRGFNVVEDNG